MSSLNVSLYDERTNCCNRCGRHRPRGHEPGCSVAEAEEFARNIPQWPPSPRLSDASVAVPTREAPAPVQRATLVAAPPPRRIRLTPASEIAPEPVVWAWEDNGHGRIPAGSLTVAAGREGTGKSSFGIWLAAQITKGTLPGALQGKPRAVIYAAVEDSWKFTIVPRLLAAGADLTRVFRVDVYVDENETTTLSLPNDLAELQEAISEYGVGLVVLDPLMSTIGSKIDTHREREVRTALDPLAGVADRTGTIILGIAHFNKGAGTDPSSLITGSGAFKNVPRAILAFAADPEDGVQVISQTKNSLGRLDLPSLAYRIVTAKVETRKGVAEVGRFVLDGEADRRVEDILGHSGTAEERAERDEAAVWLHDYIERQGETSPNDVFKAGAAAGFSKDVLKNAKKKAGVCSQKSGFSDGWVWALAEPKDTKGARRERREPGTETPRPSLPSAPLGGSCRGCGDALDPVLAENGETTHPGCNEQENP